MRSPAKRRCDDRRCGADAPSASFRRRCGGAFVARRAGVADHPERRPVLCASRACTHRVCTRMHGPRAHIVKWPWHGSSLSSLRDVSRLLLLTAGAALVLLCLLEYVRRGGWGALWPHVPTRVRARPPPTPSSSIYAECTRGVRSGGSREICYFCGTSRKTGRMFVFLSCGFGVPARKPPFARTPDSTDCE